VGRRRKNDASNLGFLLLIVIGVIVLLIQKLGWWLLLIIAIPIVIYLIYRYSKSTGNQTFNEEPNAKEFDSSWASNQVISRETKPSSPKRSSITANWVPPGQTIELHDYIIQKGLLYFGDHLPSVNSSSPEPALINPSLHVNKSFPDISGATMSYWPSYSNITSEARAAYLNWLSSDRSDPTTNIGYIFLFFYGLERRALYDVHDIDIAANRTDIPAILFEVKRLIDIYGNSSGSFRGYATSFYSFLTSYIPIEQIISNESNLASYKDLPFSLKRTLGQLSKEGKPIPAHLAFAWFKQSPEILLRTPAKRCPDEFEKLFIARYSLEYGEGMVINPNKTMLRCEYRPASSSFSGKTFSNELGGLPDITKLSRPISAFQKIADTCMEDLEAYSRFLGKKQENQGNKIFAIAQLPAEIIRHSNDPEVTSVSSFLKKTTESDKQRSIDISALFSLIGLPTDQPLSATESLQIAQLLGRLGYGIEPDIRFGGNKLDPSHKAIIFPVEDLQSSASSSEYAFAALLLSFSSLIIHADNSVSAAEENALHKHISSILSLTKSEQQRLNALLANLCITPISFTSVKKKIDSLTIESKSFILNFLISIANADGNIDPSEIKILKKIYDLFGKDSDQIYSDIHSFQTTGDAPVAISQTQPSSTGFVIPKKLVQLKKETGVSLDMDLVAKTLKQTHEVQSLLSNIFSENDDTKIDVQKVQTSSSNLIANLDLNHSELFRNLFGFESISVDDFQNLCAKLSIMPSGAIETINSASFNKTDDAYIEENEDVLLLNKEIAKEMLK
jgi:uncharacterized tellurite resistance protein B-like protein